jgi:hypothetical protein
MARKHSTRRQRKGGFWPFTSSTDAAAMPETPKRTWMQWLKGESADGSVPPSAIEQATESPPPYGGRRRKTSKRRQTGKRSSRS